MEGALSERNPDDQTLAQFRARVSSGHDVVMGADAQDLQAMRQHIASAQDSSSASSGAFAYEGPCALNIRQQIIQATGAAAVAEEEEAEKPEKEEGAPAPKKIKKATVYNVERECARRCTAWQETCVHMSIEGEHLVMEMNGQIAKYSEPHKDAQFFKPTIDLMKSRLVPLELVLAATADPQKDTDNFKSYLIDLKEKAQNTSLAHGLGQGDTHAAACAPPIVKFLDLKLLAHLQRSGDQLIRSCSTHEEANDVQAKLQAPKKALEDLIAAAKTSLGDMSKAVLGRKRLVDLEAQLGKTATADIAPAAMPNTGRRCFDIVADCSGCHVQTYSDPLSEHDQAMMDVTAPFVITGNRWAKNMLSEKDSPLAVAINKFADQFSFN